MENSQPHSGRGFVELMSIDYKETCANLVFRCSDSLSSLFWSERTVSVHSDIVLTKCETVLSSLFCLLMAPLGWMYGISIYSNLGIFDTVREAIDSVGQFTCAHYGWKYRDSLENVITRPQLRGVRDIGIGALLFSGGVDSISALLDRKAHVGYLVTLENFDVLDGSMSTGQLRKRGRDLDFLSRLFGKPVLRIRTNVADVIQHSALDRNFPTGCSFWYGLQHVHHAAFAIGFLDLPIDTVYVGGSFKKLHHRAGSCAASSEFVERYDWGRRITLVEENVSRQEKIEKILDLAPEVLKRIRVCYETGGGTCRRCPKCVGTALMIVAGGGRLANTAFGKGMFRGIHRFTEMSLARPDRDMMFDQALSGRLLSGGVANRIKQLQALVAAEA